VRALPNLAAGPNRPRKRGALHIGAAIHRSRAFGLTRPAKNVERRLMVRYFVLQAMNGR
jgi:hypothetical protein